MDTFTEHRAAKRKSVFEVIETDEKFSVLLQILNSTGMGRTLRHEENPFTFFAPTDGAFYKLFQQAAGQLTGGDSKILVTFVLGQHLIPGISLYSDDLRGKDSITTLERTVLKIRYEAHRIFLNDAQIVSPGIAATNGVVFAIDKVLLTEQQRADFIRF
jgi:uncharacterized surface protein with fasciclin (FAS1) repeats